MRCVYILIVSFLNIRFLEVLKGYSRKSYFKETSQTGSMKNYQGSLLVETEEP